MSARDVLRRAAPAALTALAVIGIGAGIGLGTGVAIASGPATTSTGTVPAPAMATPAAIGTPEIDPTTRNGHDIYRSFREGLATPGCPADISSRWSRHFAAAPRKLAHRDDTLALFGYVVQEVRKASLPTEYALIPFVESGYKPDARSSLGPAGMWQLITTTARAHDVPIRDGFDGRLSPVESTRAAVRYLKTLHGMFAGDWRLAVMAYNAGEYRIFDALERGGQVARDARPQELPGLPDLTHAYVRKLQALSCLMQQADTREQWRAAIDRPVPRLQPVELPADARRLDAWAQRTDRDAGRLRRLNPAFADGRVPTAGEKPLRVLAVAMPRANASTNLSTAIADTAGEAAEPRFVADAGPVAQPRRHTVQSGDSLWALARRYEVPLKALRQRNDLGSGSVIRPGMVLVIDAPVAAP